VAVLGFRGVGAPLIYAKKNQQLINLIDHAGKSAFTIRFIEGRFCEE